MRGGSESSAVDDEQTQPRIPPIRIKQQEIVEKVEEDGIGALPDSLLLEILSRLPSTEDAIRTGALSKRWKDLWIWVPILIFTHSVFLLDERRVNPKSRSDFVSFVDKTLTQCRHLKLKKFEVQTRWHSPNSDIQFEYQFNSWTRYAVSCKVEELNLKFWYEEKPEFQLDQILFINSYLTDLRLEGCILNPTGEISWKNLRSLFLSCVKTEEDLIESILSGSPLLETLVLERCYGYSRIDITSKSVKKLVFTAYYDPDQGPLISDDIIEINAPNILSLTIDGSLLLRKLLLVNVSSLVEAYLHFLKIEYEETMQEEAQEEMLEGFILNLRHVKDLKIGFLCSKALSRLEAKGFVSPSNIKFT